MAVYYTLANNRTWMTEATLLSLVETVNWEKHRLIISDNGSCQPTLDLYQVFLGIIPDLWIIYNHENLGTARAINEAWRHRHDDEHALKIDNDVVIHQAGWADWMEDVFDRAPSIGIVGLKRKDLSECTWSDDVLYKTTIRMLPHELGQRWLIVEDVQMVMGTCQGFSSALLDKIGYLTQPDLYGFDDGLASARAEAAGFGRVFLHGFDLDHIDPGVQDDYLRWKHLQAERYYPAFRTMKTLLDAGVMPYYDDGGFGD